MKYRYLGNSGVSVSRICLGTMTFGNSDWGCDQETATAITRSFLEAGGNFVDTADIYNAGRSEEMVGVAIDGVPREDVFLATKCWFPVGEGMNSRGLSRKHIVEACEASLRRLGTEYIDLYQIHGPDPFTPVEQTMRALDDLVRAGKVLNIGCSNLYGWQIVKANAAARNGGLTSFVSAQHLYNLLRRDIEREILPACDDDGLGMICWSPLASGMLTGKYRGTARPAETTRFGKQAHLYLPRFWFDEALGAVETVVRLAEELEKSPSEVALAWLLHDRRVTAPIVGARTVEQIKENLGAGEWDLPEEAWEELARAVPVLHGYPKDWMDQNTPKVFGRAEYPPRRHERLP